MKLTVARLGLGVGVLVAGEIALASAAAADGGDATTGNHCVQQVAGPEVAVAPAPHCFTTYPQAVAYLTGGRVQLSSGLAAEPNGSGTSPEDAQIAAAEIANSVFVLSTEYQNSGYGGSTYTFTWSSDCTSFNYAWSSMPSGWNNDISSSHAGSNCNAIHYDNAGATPNTPPAGSSIQCPTFSSCSSLGTMNDRTSSMRWVHN
ncbi:MAG: hypothetical protein QOJ11_1079 [Frankiales bacterium]|jgi:hypothetical protein|nr:hypothetical protein [Frankiales bacterium]